MMPSVSDFRLANISSGYAYQRDRLAHAVAWGKTRKECLSEFAKLMIRNSR